MLIFRPLIRYADFKGRARRAEYWGFGLVQAVFLIALLFVAGTTLANADPTQAVLGLMGWIGIIGLVVMALFIPNQAVLARRLHDTGRSAWWMALQVPNWLGPFLFSGTMFAAAQQAATSGSKEAVAAAMASGLAGSSMILMLSSLCNLALFVLTLLPGQEGPNRFGPDPKDPSRTPADDAASGLDEARLDALFAEAKRQGGGRAAEADKPYKPVFDFGPGPGPSAPEPVRSVAAPPPVDWGRPAPYDPNAPRAFGRRGA